MCKAASKARQLRIFWMSDYDWWAGYDIATVIGEYSRVNEGVYIDDVRAEARELTDAEMDNLTWVEDLASFPEGPVPITFRQRLAEMEANPSTRFPCFFATTEY